LWQSKTPPLALFHPTSANLYFYCYQIITERITLSSKTQPARRIKTLPSIYNTKSVPPAYILSISYVRSTNAGKSLLAKGKTKVEESYTLFFNEHGTMDQEAFEKWVGEAVERAMDSKNA